MQVGRDTQQAVQGWPPGGHMELNSLRVLIEVARHGSVQSAARSLDVSRTTLRRRIEALEATIGAPLLHRHAKGIQLTRAGALVVERGRELLLRSDDLVRDARAHAAGTEGVVRLITPIGFADPLRVELIKALRIAHPDIQLHSREVEEPLACLSEPFEVLAHTGPAPDTRGEWFSRVIGRVPIRLAASKSYLDEHGTPTTLEHLADHTLLQLRRPEAALNQLPLLDGGQHPIRPFLSSPNWALLRRLMSVGGGIAMWPMNEPVPSDAQLVLPDVVGSDIVFRVLTPLPSSADTRTRVFLENMQRLLTDFPEH